MSNDKMKMNNKLERMWKETVLSLHLSGETDENYTKLSQDSRCSGQHMNRTPPEYKSEPLPL
jgi:hypothetical protein